MAEETREDAELALAVARYKDALEQKEAARAALFDAAAAAVRAGRTPEELAAETPFSAADIRRQVRERGVGT
ncbi:hypothetical protein GCM10009678_94640 [Actinomadura kijaniata]|uniref:Uncharacterized protein n=1 Tax=Actinomadura namibiensis TaxID=182080 RepID=A0A7W3LT72_ACTNM|nr:hypothetical protein [Actinomadura namibiensis]MBA8953797.1 hypothetical protein [Actinomadura namibiensis]